jgi:hypothetical protein
MGILSGTFGSRLGNRGSDKQRAIWIGVILAPPDARLILSNDKT